MDNLFELEEPNNEVKNQQATLQAQIDSITLRKLNILTSKDRPFCAFCEALCGFNWYYKSKKASNQLEEVKTANENEEDLEMKDVSNDNHNEL